MKKFTFIFTMVFLFGNTVYSQSKNAESEQIGKFYSKQIISCVDDPKNVKITIDSCNSKEVWSTVNWEGNYTTLDYYIKLYIKVIDSKVKVYFLDYTNSFYKNLNHTNCIPKETEEIQINQNTVQYFPFKEFNLKK